jgi:hypothetical protein
MPIQIHPTNLTNQVFLCTLRLLMEVRHLRYQYQYPIRYCNLRYPNRRYRNLHFPKVIPNRLRYLLIQHRFLHHFQSFHSNLIFFLNSKKC